MAKFVSEIFRVQRMLDQMAVAALRGACMAVANQAKLETRRGFKTGKYITNGWTSITYRVQGAPNYLGQVGSWLKHFAFWELGHRNAFTGQYERNRWLTRAFEKSRQAQIRYALAASRQVATRYGVMGQVAYGKGRRVILDAAAAARPAAPRPRLPG